MNWRLWGSAGLLLCCAQAQPVLAATLLMQPGDSLAQVLKSAADGDEILIQAGTYSGQVAVITQQRLTLRGIGGRPVFEAAGRSAEGKAILVVRNGDIRIENIEFRGTRVADGNGAGIRFEKGRLQVVRSAFFDNQNGILTANFGDAELQIIDSEFGNAPAGRSLPHLIYVGRIARFTLTGSRVRAGNGGHLVKSRAAENFIRYNELVDGPGGRAAYELEFPNGGLAVVVGNVIGQSEETTNPAIVSYAAEGLGVDVGSRPRPRTHGLYMAHNTLINARLRPGVFVHMHEPPKQASDQPVPLRLFNNLFVGLGASNAGWAELRQGNFPIHTAMLRDVHSFDYRLGPSSWLRGRAVEVPELPEPIGKLLRPTAQFKMPAGTTPLPADLQLSPGAVQVD